MTNTHNTKAMELRIYSIQQTLLDFQALASFVTREEADEFADNLPKKLKAKTQPVYGTTEHKWAVSVFANLRARKGNSINESGFARLNLLLKVVPVDFKPNPKYGFATLAEALDAIGLVK